LLGSEHTLEKVARRAQPVRLNIGHRPHTGDRIEQRRRVLAAVCAVFV